MQNSKASFIILAAELETDWNAPGHPHLLYPKSDTMLVPLGQFLRLPLSGPGLHYS